MEDLYRLMAASLPPISGNAPETAILQDALQRLQKKALQDASERFEKQTLLQLHDLLARQVRKAESRYNSVLPSFSSDPRASGSGGAASSVPYERLNPIPFTELQAGEVHRGRVVYGTLCAEAYRMCAITTLLEDDNGLAVRLAIYNAAPFQADIKKLYPMGTKVAVKEPYFKIANDGGLIIRVDNPANVVKLMIHKGKPTESLLHLDVEDVRKEGNKCFREQNWNAAAEHYTKCIDAALLQLKDSSSNGNNNIIDCLLHAYSNRAETWLQIKEFKWALEDSNDALRIDIGHLKALYRKGRALLGLKHYGAACECLKQADKTSAGQREIQEALGRAKTLYTQSRSGKYDISDYLLGQPTSSPPEVADFVGRVEIKMTEDGRGRGLYATRKIRTGELLLVSNPVAVAYGNASTTAVCMDKALNTASQVDLVAAVVCHAGKSQKLLRQLYSLHYSSTPSSLEVPAIDLFKTDGHMSEGQAEQDGNLQVDVNRIREIINSNSFGAAEGHMFASRKKRLQVRLCQRGHSFTGLWLLPSLINHSCLPNSSRLDVGRAMFIHASKPIERGEEITISYFDTLLPLPQRQSWCENWGFKCKCKRCVLEHSLRTSLEPIITARFEQMHDQAQDELISKRSRQPFDVDLPACAEFGKISIEAEGFIRRSQLLKTEEEKNWIRASFMSAYLVGAQSEHFVPIMLNSCFPSMQKLMEAIQTTVPGDYRNLDLAAPLFKECQSWTGDGNEGFSTRHASEQAREVFISVFGRHSEDVLKALVLKHSN